jgi:endonuclease-3
MIKQKSLKSDFIQKTLQELVGSLDPFLLFSTDLECLIAISLSAQTKDLRVNSVTPTLFSYIKTPEDLVNMDVVLLENIIKPLGFYKRKAFLLKQLGVVLVKDFSSSVPQSKESLKTLPGVGEKTASVFRSQFYHFPEFPVDTHVQRLAIRWGLSTHKNPDRISEDLKDFFPKDQWNKISLQMIQFGRNFCLARKKHSCTICDFIEGKKDS